MFSYNFSTRLGVPATKPVKSISGIPSTAGFKGTMPSVPGPVVNPSWARDCCVPPDGLAMVVASRRNSKRNSFTALPDVLVSPRFAKLVRPVPFTLNPGRSGPGAGQYGSLRV